MDSSSSMHQYLQHLYLPVYENLPGQDLQNDKSTPCDNSGTLSDIEAFFPNPQQRFSPDQNGFMTDDIFSPEISQQNIIQPEGEFDETARLLQQFLHDGDQAAAPAGAASASRPRLDNIQTDGLTCLHCAKTFSRKDALTRHIRELSERQNQQLTLLCPVQNCSKGMNIQGFARKEHLQTYIRLHHLGHTDAFLPEEMNPKPKKISQTQCQACEKDFSADHALTRHIKAFALKDENHKTLARQKGYFLSKIIICPLEECDRHDINKAFARKDHLNNHLRKIHPEYYNSQLRS